MAVKQIDWYHSIRLPDGVTSGKKPAEALQREADAVFAMPLRGKSVLDIGAWDGFFSFEAARRGAADVLATDHHCWSGPGWGTKAGFDTAHAALGSKVRSKDVDVFDLDPAVEGHFDVVLFLGVLYHLKNPYSGLAQAARMAREVLVVETHTTLNSLPLPVLRHFPAASLNNDGSNFFAPNVACLKSMLAELGFAHVAVATHPNYSRKLGDLLHAPWREKHTRHLVHAFR